MDKIVTEVFYTIANKVGKTIIIQTQEQEKCRVSVLSTIIADRGNFLLF